MRRSERGYSLAEMMIGLFAFSLILSSIIFLLTRWQQTTAITRVQRSLALDAREALRQISADVREASYIYHWAELDVKIHSNAIPGHSAADPYEVKTGVKASNGKWAIPAVTTRVFAGANLKTVPSIMGQFGLGEPSLTGRLTGTATESWNTLALASISDGGLARPTYVIYFAYALPASDDDVNNVYRFQFQPAVNAPADTWYPMSETFAAQPASRSLIIKANANGTGTITRVTGGGGTVNGNWQLKKLFSTINHAPANAQDPRRQFANGLFYIRQLHPWSDETPISPFLVEAAVIPSERFGGRIASFPLFGRAYARNVAMPSAE